MIKRVKTFDSDGLINSEKYKNFVEKFESEILRGISTLSILTIIQDHGKDGIYGYQLLQELKAGTNDMLVIEEGTLYPLLKKLERQEILTSQRLTSSGRPRNYYFLTDFGYNVYNHISGFFTKLIEAIGPLMEFEVDLEEKYIYCPNCSNKIDLNEGPQFCVVCGYNIGDRINPELKGGNKNE